MIRKIIFALLAVCLLSFSTEAQKHPQLRYISLDAGVNMAGIRSSGNYDNHAKNYGVRLGLSGNYSLSNLISLGAALAFEQKGAADPVYDINTNLNYLALPVYIKLTAGRDPRLFLTTGVYVSTLLNANRRGERFISGQSNAINEKVTAEFNPLDIGLTAGGGIIVRLYDDFDFLISAGISSGLLNIADTPGHSPKNYHINISAGYIYYIGFR
jgi:hypothetical protein